MKIKTDYRYWTPCPVCKQNTIGKIDHDDLNTEVISCDMCYAETTGTVQTGSALWKAACADKARMLAALN